MMGKALPILGMAFFFAMAALSVVFTYIGIIGFLYQDWRFLLIFILLMTYQIRYAKYNAMYVKLMIFLRVNEYFAQWTFLIEEGQ